MDRDNIFRSCSFHADAGDVIHVLIKDLVGEGFVIGLNETTGETTEDEVEVQPEGEVYLKSYGSLYNGYAVSDPRNIAPIGWHIPTAAEFITLITYLGGEATTGGRLKTVGLDYWNSPNTGATNNVGFNLKGAGVRGADGIYQNTKDQTHLWSSTEIDPSTGYIRVAWWDQESFYGGNCDKNWGNTIRLLKDTTTLTHGQTATCVGNDGKVYNSICIGTQEWTSQNIAETKYRSSLKIEYGALYNWYAATDIRNIANTGWHVPTRVEFDILIAYLGGSAVAGGKLKETGFTYWSSPNTGATNEVGFNLRGAGWRWYNGGTGIVTFSGLNTQHIILTNEQYGINRCYTYYLSNTTASINQSATVEKKSGCTIRLIKDSTILSNGEEGVYVGNDGHVYRSIAIGGQEWLADNLAETKYRDGTDIPIVTDDTTWAALVTGAMCYYNNDIDNAVTVGDTIPEVTDVFAWSALVTGARCFYEDTEL